MFCCSLQICPGKLCPLRSVVRSEGVPATLARTWQSSEHTKWPTCQTGFCQESAATVDNFLSPSWDFQKEASEAAGPEAEALLDGNRKAAAAALSGLSHCCRVLHRRVLRGATFPSPNPCLHGKELNKMLVFRFLGGRKENIFLDSLHLSMETKTPSKIHRQIFCSSKLHGVLTVDSVI